MNTLIESAEELKEAISQVKVAQRKFVTAYMEHWCSTIRDDDYYKSKVEGYEPHNIGDMTQR